MFLPAGKSLDLTPVTEEGNLGLLLVVNFNYATAHARPPINSLSGLYFEESDELDKKLDHGKIDDLPDGQVLILLYCGSPDL